jgi:hypothetical protein
VHFPNAFVIVDCRDCGVGSSAKLKPFGWGGELGKDSTNTSAGRVRGVGFAYATLLHSPALQAATLPLSKAQVGRVGLRPLRSAT